jgi:hypothetical protein
MTDLPMDPTEHPEEGLIHAWLDDALGAAEAERIAAHVRTCAECQARVAEARGLIAGASRIVAALDDAAPAGRPAWAQSALAEGGAASGAPAAASAPASGAGSLWRRMRVTPGRAALAATLLVAIGITLTYDRVAIDSASRSMTSVLNRQRADVPATTSPEGDASGAAKPQDALLDSATARNVEIAQGRSRLEAARGPSIPEAPPPTATLPARVGAAGEAVALGRASAEAARESAAIAPDRSYTAVTSAPLVRRDITGATASIQPTAPASSDRPGAVRREQLPGGPPSDQVAANADQASQAYARTADGAELAKRSANAVARSCFRLDSPDTDARWADQPFPLVLAVEPGPAGEARDAAVLTPTGQTTQLRARWTPRGGDSVSIVLRRIGYSGSMVLGPDAGARSGLAVSAAAPTRLEELSVAMAPAQAQAQAQVRARADAERAEARKAAAPAAPQASPAPGPPVRQLRITARSVACP